MQNLKNALKIEAISRQASRLKHGVFLGAILIAQETQTDSAPDTTLFNPLGTSEPEEVIGRIIKGALGLTGILALFLFMYGGFLIFTSRGNKEKITKGWDALKWAIIGLFIIFASYSLLAFVFKVLRP